MVFKSRIVGWPICWCLVKSETYSFVWKNALMMLVLDLTVKTFLCEPNELCIEFESALLGDSKKNKWHHGHMQNCPIKIQKEMQVGIWKCIDVGPISCSQNSGARTEIYVNGKSPAQQSFGFYHSTLWPNSQHELWSCGTPSEIVSARITGVDIKGDKNIMEAAWRFRYFTSGPSRTSSWFLPKADETLKPHFQDKPSEID